jgi:tetratricopeptide (TPR) repeat protein
MTTVSVDQDMASITVPKIGISLQSIAAAISFFSPNWRDELSGEFTQSGSELSLRLRLNGKSIFSDTAATSDYSSAAEMLIGTTTHGAGFEVVRATQPYVAASALYGNGRHTDIAKVENELDDIIARFPDRDAEVLQAYNLQGLIEYNRHKYEKAKDLFERTIELNPERAIAPNNRDVLAVAYSNLAMLYNTKDYPQYDVEKAIEQYQAALELYSFPGPHQGLGAIYRERHETYKALAEFSAAEKLATGAAGPHVDIGNVYRDQRMLEDAFAEYTAAMHLEPTYPVPHVLRGEIYEGQRKLEDAKVEYTTAIHLDPTVPKPHVELGSIYEQQHKLQDAEVEYMTAINLDPANDEPHYKLGVVRLQESIDAGPNDPTFVPRLQDACQAFADASERNPNDANYRAQMSKVDQILNGHGHCPPTQAVTSAL